MVEHTEYIRCRGESGRRIKRKYYAKMRIMVTKILIVNSERAHNVILPTFVSIIRTNIILYARLSVEKQPKWDSVAQYLY